MDDYTIGSVAASVFGRKSPPGQQNKLFASAPSGYTVRYAPVKQEVKIRSPIHKLAKKHVIREESDEVHEMNIKKEETETGKMKKRKIGNMLVNSETETEDVFKRKRKKDADKLNYSCDSETLTNELAQSKKKKNKMKLVPSEMNIEILDTKAEQAYEGNTKKKNKKLPFYEKIMPLKKKKKEQKERNDGTVDEAAMEFKKEDTFNMTLETKEHKFVPSEMNIKLPCKKTKYSREKKKQKIPISEFAEVMLLKKKKKELKAINYETVEEGAVTFEKEDTFSLSSETEECAEEKFKADESEKEDEEELSNKQCALKRLEKKRLKEIKLQHIDEEQNARTVFVGNVPNDIKKKRLMKFFSKFGTVKSVRLRCAPLADPRVPKKVAIIRQKYHPERSNIHAFVCFEDVESTHKALEANGTLIGEHHIRVDLLNNKQSYDQKKAVFVGNLPFAAEEDDLWKMFEPCGAISNIRIVRDRVSGVGKGFAYVNFKSADAVELALKLDGEELKKRKLRISRYARKPIGKFVNKHMLHKPGFQNNARLVSTTKERNDRKEIFRYKPKAGKTSQIAENRTQARIVKKKVKASYQGHKIAENQKMKKNKKRVNRAEVKKMILVNKLGVGPKSKKSSKKVQFKLPSS